MRIGIVAVVSCFALMVCEKAARREDQAMARIEANAPPLHGDQ